MQSLPEGKARKTGVTAAAKIKERAGGAAQDERFTIKRFADYRWDGDSIEVKVEWEKGRPTWEPEANLHSDAPNSLLAFWTSKHGHPTNPKDADLYEVHSIRNHTVDCKKLLVTWVGFGPEDATWEPCTALERSAGDVVADYWKSVEAKSETRQRRTQKTRKRQEKH